MTTRNATATNPARTTAPRVRIWRILFAAITVVAVAAACSSESDGVGSAPTTKAPAETTTAPSTAPTSAATLVEPGSRYVSLGSSFAAGAGLPTQSEVCGRSDQNYPHLVAQELDLDLVDASCGGAVTANVLDQPQGDEPPQIDALDADTRLVTLTVGGNDIQYALNSYLCGSQPTDCVPTLDTATIDAAVADLPNRLGALFDAIEQRSPEAEVILVTYPQVVPDDDASCAALEFASDEAAYLSDIGKRLDAAFRSAVADTDVLLVDAYTASADHGPCSDDPWMTGLELGAEGAPYHPTAAGHQGMADLVLKAVNAGG